jgi:hypothetical protein
VSEVLDNAEALPIGDSDAPLRTPPRYEVIKQACLEKNRLMIFKKLLTILENLPYVF